jgi:hypothetical protein
MVHLPADGVTRLSAIPGFTEKAALILAEKKIETVKDLIGTLAKKIPLFVSHESLLKHLDEVIAEKTGIDADNWDVNNSSEAIVAHLRSSAFLPIEACTLMAEALEKGAVAISKAPNSKDDAAPKIGHVVINDRSHLVLVERLAGGAVAYRVRPLWTETEAKGQGIAPMAPGDPIEGAKVQIKLQGVGAVYWNERIVGSKGQERRYVHLPRAKKASLSA